MRRYLLTFLKLAGLFLFLWILARIDRAALARTLQSADIVLLLSGFLLTFAVYVCKTLRWRIFAEVAHVRLTIREAWIMTNIGLALAVITPAKLGELGRAAYLRRHGTSGAMAVALVVADRLTDVLCIALLAIVAVGILFGTEWSLLIALGLLALAALSPLLWFLAFFVARVLPILRALLPVTHTHRLIRITLWTLAGWAAYFASIILLARAIGIDTTIPHLVAVLTLTGIVALLPIAPSGLGTRDAALITLLAPLGITEAEAVALGLLMFLTIVLSTLPGLWYWLRDRNPPPPKHPDRMHRQRPHGSGTAQIRSDVVIDI